MTFVNGLLLLCASAVLLVPLLWRRPGGWLDPLLFFGATVFVWGFGKYLFLALLKPIDGLPPWAVAADLQNGVIATSMFALAAAAGYLVARSGSRVSAGADDRAPLDVRIIYFVAIALTSVSLLAFLAILNSPNLEISWEVLSAKRFIDSDLGPASRVGSTEYLLYKATLMARVPLYAVLVAALVRGRANLADIVLLVFNFMCIFVVAFIFSNRFNLLLGFVDMVAIAAVLLRRIISTRIILLGFGVFAALIVTSELRMGEGRDRSVLEHIYEGRYFADVERTDRVVDYYASNPKVNGETLYDWLYLFIPADYGDGGNAFLNMGWEIGYHVFGFQLSGVPPGFIGELFMNFGWWGVALGGLLFGIAAAYVAVRLHERTVPTWLAVFLALVAVRIGLVLFNGNFGTAMIKIAFEALPASLLIWMATRQWQTQRVPGGRASGYGAVREG